MAEKPSSTYRVFSVVKKSSLLISGIAVFLMMLFISAEVILRNVFSTSISGNYEITESYFMPLIVFPVIAITYSSGLMPKINMVVNKFPGKIQSLINLLLLLLEILAMFLIVFLTWSYAVDATKDGIGFSAGSIMYPLYPVFYLVPLGFALLIIELLFDFITVFKRVLNFNDKT